MDDRPPTRTVPLMRMALWIVLLPSAMLLPFLPGRHDPLVISLSAAATVVAFGSLLLVLVGVAWLMSSRGYVPARLGLVVTTLIATGAALATASTGSMTAAVFLFGLGCLARPALATCRRGTSGSRGFDAYGADRADRGSVGGDGRPHGARRARRRVEPRPGDRELGSDHLGHRTVPRTHGRLSGRAQLAL